MKSLRISIIRAITVLIIAILLAGSLAGCNEKRPYEVSGHVLDMDEKGIVGVTLAFPSGSTLTAITNDNGYWEAVLKDKTTVTPFKSGYSFNPDSRLVTYSSSGRSGINFTGIRTINDQEITLTLPGGVPLEMVLIPDGIFQMGSPDTEQHRDIDEGPQHQVTISKTFYMGTYEVTQRQWAAVMGTNPSHFDNNLDNPVDTLSWLDCRIFINQLNTLGMGAFRMPTEAEWEFACRAGSTTRFPWGDDPDYINLGQYAWYPGNSSFETHPVGQKEPNAWGLYDMNGNVSEWCNDWFCPYTAESQTDPMGPTIGGLRVYRGGNWANLTQNCRSADRKLEMPAISGINLGFRLVMIVR